jgi:hypothetical protein
VPCSPLTHPTAWPAAINLETFTEEDRCVPALVTLITQHVEDHSLQQTDLYRALSVWLPRTLHWWLPLTF